MGPTIQPLAIALLSTLRDRGKRWSYQTNFLDFTSDKQWRHEMRFDSPRIRHDGKLMSFRRLLDEFASRSMREEVLNYDYA